MPTPERRGQLVPVTSATTAERKAIIKRTVGDRVVEWKGKARDRTVGEEEEVVVVEEEEKGGEEEREAMMLMQRLKPLSTPSYLSAPNPLMYRHTPTIPPLHSTYSILDVALTLILIEKISRICTCVKRSASNAQMVRYYGHPKLVT